MNQNLRNKKYKVHVADYNPEQNSLLCSFSSDETRKDAKDYQSFNYDLTMYKDMTPEDIIKEIAKGAPTICEEIENKEKYTINIEDDEIFQKLENKDFEFTHEELFPTLYQEPMTWAERATKAAEILETDPDYDFGAGPGVMPSMAPTPDEMLQENTAQQLETQSPLRESLDLDPIRDEVKPSIKSEEV